MSRMNMVTITCPNCEKEHPYKIWESINTKLDPEMKAAVKDRSAFTFECPDCGAKTRVDYGFLYHQMEDHMMIFYSQTDENAEEIYNMIKDESPNSLFKTMKEENYLIRIVRSQDELIEKINIFDDGLDDRIIEIIKMLYLAIYQHDNPDAQRVMLFYIKRDDKHSLEIIEDNQYKGYFTITNEMYENICKEHLEKLPDIRKDIPFINSSWAMDKLDLFKKV